MVSTSGSRSHRGRDAYDVPLHRFIRDEIPDPVVFNARFSNWGSYLGEWYVDGAIFLGLGIFGDGKARRVAAEGLQALAAVGIFSFVSKHIFRLERPSFDDSQKRWFSRWIADAFPGGHTMTAFATATVLASEYPMLAWVAYPLAVYVAFARVQASTHWVSDDIVGAVIGVLIGRGAVEANRRVLPAGAQVIPTIGPQGAGAQVTFPW